MAVTNTPNVLATGQATASGLTTLYTAGASTYILTHITLTNVHASTAVDAQLQIRTDGSNDRAISPNATLDADGGTWIHDTPVVLETGDIIKVNLSAAITVDYSVLGATTT